VSPIQGGAVVDACTLKNFSVVGRMDVLEKHFTGRARWTEAIQREADPATLHLGEAEAIYVLERYHPDWTFVSDDQPAIDFARRKGLTAIDSEAVLAGCYENGLVGCPEAFDLLNSMADAGRGVRVPPSHWFVCPPTPRPETRPIA